MIAGCVMETTPNIVILAPLLLLAAVVMGAEMMGNPFAIIFQALLLILIITALNLAAIWLRTRLRRKFVASQF